MKLLYKTLLILLFSSNVVAASKSQTYDATILRVIDGDTIVVAAPWLPDPLKKEIHVRIWGIDTPEKGYLAKCPIEEKMGKEATQYAIDAIRAASKTQYVIMSWDKFGGRILGDVLLDGKSYRTMILSKGLARENLSTTKRGWCN